MPFGNGYSVESQVTGKDAAGGIQFEVTSYQTRPEPACGYPTLKPVLPPRGMNGKMTIFVKTVGSKWILQYYPPARATQSTTSCSRSITRKAFLSMSNVLSIQVNA
jgi:hypothetical protein